LATGFVPDGSFAGGQMTAQLLTQVTFFCLSGTNMYRVRPFALTKTVPSLGSVLVEITTEAAFLAVALVSVAADVTPVESKTAIGSAMSGISSFRMLEPPRLPWIPSDGSPAGLA
jgi:hypothetical protein